MSMWLASGRQMKPTLPMHSVGLVDQYSGKILYIQDPHRFTAGEKFLEWQYPLHCGEAFGNTGRALIMVLGLVPLTLYVTGFLRWRQKQRARKT